MAQGQCARCSVSRESLGIGGAAGAASWGVPYRPCVGFRIQQAQACQRRHCRADWRRSQETGGSEGGEVCRVDRRAAGEWQRVPSVAAGGGWAKTATADGARRRRRDGGAVVEIGVGGLV